MFRQASRFIRSLSQDIVNIAPQFYEDTKLVAQEAFILYPYMFNNKQRGFTLGHVANPYGQDDPITTVLNSKHDMFVVTDSGRLLSKGHNTTGALGHGRSEPDAVSLTRVEGVPPVKQVVVGTCTTTVLTRDGEVWTWGDTRYGENASLGLGDINSQLYPAQIKSLPPVTAIAGGHEHVLALDVNGTLWTWGDNRNGVLSLGSAIARIKEPMPLSVLVDFPMDAIACGPDFSFTLKKAVCDTSAQSNVNSSGVEEVKLDKQGALVLPSLLFGWGTNDRRQLGVTPMNEASDYEYVPRLVEFPHTTTSAAATDTDSSAADACDINFITAGIRSAAALSSTGLVYSWGYGLQSTPTPVARFNLAPGESVVNVGRSVLGGPLFAATNMGVLMRGGEDGSATVRFPGHVNSVGNGYRISIVAKVPLGLVDKMALAAVMSPKQE